MSATANDGGVDWAGPGSAPFQWRRVGLWRILRAQIVPPKGHRVVPTRAGIVLIILALALGMAAYNTASNILFITLSLLLSSLILSGMLSWVNFGGCCWRMHAQPPFRAGQDATVSITVENRKKHLPSYCLWFDTAARRSEKSGRLVIYNRLAPGEQTRLEWMFIPARRGREIVELTSVGSQYPFGFLSKLIPGEIKEEIRVWPERIGYVWNPDRRPNLDFQGERSRRPGAGSDFVHVRKYQTGDPHRQIHWKATARLGRMMVRQVQAEIQSGYIVFIDSSRELWPDEPAFETMCRLAASLAEDLFRCGQLRAAVINAAAPIRIQRLADLEFFLDELAIVERAAHSPRAPAAGRAAVITFAPGLGDRVDAYVGNSKAASA